MGDWTAKWTGLGTFGVDVDPLVVTRGIREQVDLFLGNRDVVGIAQVGSNKCLVGLNTFNVRSHNYLLFRTLPVFKSEA